MGSKPAIRLTALLACAVLFAGCTRHIEHSDYAPPPPPPAPQAPDADLMGAPAGSTTLSDADRAAREANADSRWQDDLPAGLIARHVPDPNHPGRTMLVISNRPIENPAGSARVSLWRPHHHLAGGRDLPQVGREQGPGRLSTQSAPVPATPAPTPALTPPQVAAAPVSAPTPQAAAPTPVAPPAPAISPLFWALGVLALLLLAVMFALGNRKPRKRAASPTPGGAGARHG